MAKSATYQAIIALGAKLDKTFGPTMNAAQKGVKAVGKSVQIAAKTTAIAGAAIGAGVLAAGAAAIKLGTTVVKQFGELEQNLGGSEAVFGEYASKIQKIGEEAYKNLGVSQSDYLATANKMGALFQGSGIKQAKSLELTEKAMQRATDMASVMGIDTQVALDSVAGAAKGNFTMMDNLGVAMNATNIEAYALAKGLKFTWKTATQAEKAEVAMQMFFDNTKQYAGNFARESTKTITGSIGLLKAAVGSFTGGLGNANADMTNLTGNVVDAFKAVVTNVVPIFKNIASALPVAFAAFLPAVGELLPTLLGTFTEMASQVLDMGIKLLPGLTPFVVDAILTISQAMIDNLPLLTTAAIKLGSELIKGITSALPELIPAMAKAGMEALKQFSGIFSGFDGGIFESLIAIIPDLGKQFMDIARTVGPPVMSLFQSLATNILPPVMTLIKTIATSVMPALIAMIQKLLPVLMPIIEIVGQIAGKLIELVSAVLPIVTAQFSKTISYISIVFGGLMDAIMPVVQGVMGILGGLVDFITGVFTGDWETAWMGVQKIFGGIVQGLEGLFKAPLNAIIGMLNRAFASIGSISIPDWVPVLGGKTFALPQIPLLYTGTRNWGGGPAVVGDRGPEIIDLPRGANVYSNDETNSMMSRLRDFGEMATNIVIKAPITINGPITKEQATQAADDLTAAVEAVLTKLEAKRRRASFAG